MYPALTFRLPEIAAPRKMESHNFNSRLVPFTDGPRQNGVSENMPFGVTPVAMRGQA